MRGKAKAVSNKIWTAAAGEAGIRIRMYRVGFGDFFLLSFLRDSGAPLHVIIDCGVFKGTSQTGDIGSIEAAVGNMADVTDGNIELIIMTHRHADHIAGFARCSAVFKSLHVGAVWMPVWECEYSAPAMKYQAELTATAQRLNQYLASLGAAASEAQQTARKYMENAVGVAGSGSNAAALDLLKHELGVAPKYYQGGSEPELPDTLRTAGLKADILGPPPVDDLQMMKLMDVKKGVGQYLDSVGLESAGLGAGDCTPFDPEWECQSAQVCDAYSTVDYGVPAFREWAAQRSNSPCMPQQQARVAQQKMELTLQEAQPIAALTAAKQLNSFLNNQSLVVLFTFQGKKLLFAGDAQAGNWEHWLFATDTPDQQAGGELAQRAKEILAGLDFYKVGHHGSSNATPIPAVQAMGTVAHRFVALCSTEAGVYGHEDFDDKSKGTEVPRAPLLEALGDKSALVRSDQIPATFGAETVAPKVTTPLPANGPGYRLQAGPVWVDCYL